MGKNLVIVGLILALILALAWGPITNVGRAVGRGVSAGWAAAWNVETTPEAVPATGELPLTTEELDLLIAARCADLDGNYAAAWAYVDGVEYPCSENGPAAPGPVEDELLTENVWNGKNAEWALVPKEAGENQWFVAHGDLYADGGSNIAAFKTRAEAQTELRDATWKILLVTVNPDLETLQSHLEALNLRLGGDYTIKP